MGEPQKKGDLQRNQLEVMVHFDDLTDEERAFRELLCKPGELSEFMRQSAAEWSARKAAEAKAAEKAAQKNDEPKSRRAKKS